LPCHVFFLSEHALALSEKSGRKAVPRRHPARTTPARTAEPGEQAGGKVTKFHRR
jgi:hypothetical protein